MSSEEVEIKWKPMTDLECVEEVAWLEGKEQMPLVEFIENVLMIELSVWQKAQIVKHTAIPKDRLVRKERMNVAQTKEESS